MRLVSEGGWSREVRIFGRCVQAGKSAVDRVEETVKN